MMGLAALGEAPLASLIPGETSAVVLPTFDALEAEVVGLVWLVEIEVVQLAAEG